MSWMEKASTVIQRCSIVSVLIQSCIRKQKPGGAGKKNGRESKCGGAKKAPKVANEVAGGDVPMDALPLPNQTGEEIAAA